MSSDNSDKFNRRRPMDDKSSSNVVDNEVRKLIKENPNHISQTTMYKLRERYGDQELLDQIQDSFVERTREVRKRAKKFARMISERYGNSNYPLHILLKKALKYKKKYNLSDPEFEEFRRIYEQQITGESRVPDGLSDTSYTVQIPDRFITVSGRRPQSIEPNTRIASYTVVGNSGGEKNTSSLAVSFTLQPGLDDTIFNIFGNASNKNVITSVISIIGDQSGLRKDFTFTVTRPTST